MIHIEELGTEDTFSVESGVLRITDESPNPYKVYRLFTGQVKLSCEDTLREYEVHENALASHYEPIDTSFAQTIAKYIIDEEDIDSIVWLGDIIQKPQLKRKNHKYFQELFDEICAYHLSIAAHNYVQAFVHEYRMIEYIAYACPLIYAIRSQDFYTTFGHLENYVKNEGRGELGFLQKAISKIFEGSEIFSTSFDISLDSIGNTNIKNCYRSIFNNRIKQEWLHESSSDNIFALKFNSVGSMLIELRNKIFHHSVNTSNNILSSKLIDINLFMKLITPTFFTWLGVVYTEIFKAILEFEDN